MELFTLLVLIGLASVGALAVAYIIAAAFLAVCAVTSLILVVLFVINGIIGDYFYDKKVSRGKAEFRLPWFYRWRGWRIGHDSDNSADYQNSVYLDREGNRWVPVVRRRSAFSERHTLGWHS